MTASVMGALNRREHLLRINSDAKDRRRSSDLARPRCTPRFPGGTVNWGWATSRKVYAAWPSAIYLIITPRLFFPNRTAQDFVPERKSRRYSLQEEAFDGLSKGRACSAGQTREAGIVA